MTFEEARNRLLKSAMPYDKAQREYDAVCLTALEKQIPKKPDYVPPGLMFCPVCDWFLQYEYEVPLEYDMYCGCCGQRLDWGKEE